MSDKNPPTKPTYLAAGKVRDDVFEHVFDRISDDLRAIGLMPMRNSLKNMKGKKIRIEIHQERA